MPRTLGVRILTIVSVCLASTALVATGCGGAAGGDDEVKCGDGSCAGGDVCCSVPDTSYVCWSGGGGGCADEWCYPGCVPAAQCTSTYPAAESPSGYRCAGGHPG